MPSHKLVFRRSLNFTSDYRILKPPTIPFHHYTDRWNQPKRRRHFPLSHAQNSGRKRLLGAFIFAQGKRTCPRRRRLWPRRRCCRNPVKDHGENHVDKDAAASTYTFGADQTNQKRPKFQLRTFQLQQLYNTLIELELPRLLAPDLPSICYSLGVINRSHSYCKWALPTYIVIYSHYLRVSPLGNLRACCLS